MADNAKPTTKYYRSRIAGLSVIVGEPDAEKGEVAPQTVRFTPIVQRWDGDMTPFGYLETDNEVAHAKLANDSNVEEIEAAEFKEIFKKADDASVTSVLRGTL